MNDVLPTLGSPTMQHLIRCIVVGVVGRTTAFIVVTTSLLNLEVYMFFSADNANMTGKIGKSLLFDAIDVDACCGVTVTSVFNSVLRTLVVLQKSVTLD